MDANICSELLQEFLARLFIRLYPVAPLGISVDGFPNDKKVTLFEFGNFWLRIDMLTQKINGFRNPLLKINGFPGTHGTHANGATVGRRRSGQAVLRNICNELLEGFVIPSMMAAENTLISLEILDTVFHSKSLCSMKVENFPN